MIIKVTLNDNDFTQFIESYFKRFAFDNYYYYINKVYKMIHKNGFLYT